MTEDKDLIARLKSLVLSRTSRTQFSRLGWALPAESVLIDGPIPFSTGMHIMLAPKAAGKTYTSLALGAWFVDHASGTTKEQLEGKDKRTRARPAIFWSVMEPRSPEGFAPLGGAEGWDQAYKGKLEQAKGGLLIIDSLTYLVQQLSAVKALGRTYGTVTFKGGLSPRDIVGVLAHDTLAREAGVAVVATINSELFPVVDKFEGACEGELKLLTPGVFERRDRDQRTRVVTQIPDTYMEQARQLLGFSDNSSTSNMDIA